MEKIILTGGGTGGHVYPNLALIPTLQKEGFEVVYVGGEGDTIEKRLTSPLGIEYHSLPTVKLVRGLSLRAVKNNLSIPFVLARSVAKGRRLLKDLSPNLIFAKGGYVSLPLILAHGRTPLICHESDLSLGIANKIGKLVGARVLTANPLTKGECVGIPLRQDLFAVDKTSARKALNIPQKDLVLLVVGGSSGSYALNNAVINHLNTLTKSYTVVHVYGDKGFVPPKKTDKYIPLPYANDMATLYAVSDVVLSRAGATAVAELSALGKKALFVPLPKGVSRGDQLDNALFARSVGGRVMYETDLHLLPQEIDKTLHSPSMKSTYGDTNGKIVEIIRDSISRGEKCKNKKQSQNGWQ
jgi:UDP-N-acetylglucosamine--N-acetylmuramyl-(pentapeptide) pyrophosphoryl-undecaprenol N-acetylglucosamine transferase